VYLDDEVSLVAKRTLAMRWEAEGEASGGGRSNASDSVRWRDAVRSSSKKGASFSSRTSPFTASCGSCKAINPEPSEL